MSSVSKLWAIEGSCWKDAARGTAQLDLQFVESFGVECTVETRVGKFPISGVKVRVNRTDPQFTTIDSGTKKCVGIKQEVAGKSFLVEATYLHQVDKIIREEGPPGRRVPVIAPAMLLKRELVRIQVRNINLTNKEFKGITCNTISKPLESLFGPDGYQIDGQAGGRDDVKFDSASRVFNVKLKLATFSLNVPYANQNRGDVTLTTYWDPPAKDPDEPNKRVCTYRGWGCCEPTSAEMLLRYWGIGKTRDEIMRMIYDRWKEKKTIIWGKQITEEFQYRYALVSPTLPTFREGMYWVHTLDNKIERDQYDKPSGILETLDTSGPKGWKVKYVRKDGVFVPSKVDTSGVGPEKEKYVLKEGLLVPEFFVMDNVIWWDRLMNGDDPSVDYVLADYLTMPSRPFERLVVNLTPAGYCYDMWDQRGWLRLASGKIKPTSAIETDVWVDLNDPGSDVYRMYHQSNWEKMGHVDSVDLGWDPSVDPNWSTASLPTSPSDLCFVRRYPVFEAWGGKQSPYWSTLESFVSKSPLPPNSCGPKGILVNVQRPMKPIFLMKSIEVWVKVGSGEKLREKAEQVHAETDSEQRVTAKLPGMSALKLWTQVEFEMDAWRQLIPSALKVQYAEPPAADGNINQEPHYTDVFKKYLAKGFPIMVGTNATSFGHIMVVRGFVADKDEKVKWLILNDPYGSLTHPQANYGAFTISGPIGEGEANQNSDVQKVQQYLIDIGKYSGDANGLWDGTLKDAIKQFQVENNVDVKVVKKGTPPTGSGNILLNSQTAVKMGIVSAQDFEYSQEAVNRSETEAFVDGAIGEHVYYNQDTHAKKSGEKQLLRIKNWVAYIEDTGCDVQSHLVESGFFDKNGSRKPWV